MGRITVTIDDHMLRRIRARALVQGTSPTSLVREYLEAFAASDPVHAMALQTMLSLSRPAPGRHAARSAELNADQPMPLRLIS
jgi:hypothetical protein